MMTKNMRITDLVCRRRAGAQALLSVRLPVELIERVDALVDRLGSSKAAVVVALLNEGLDRAPASRSGRRNF